MINSNKIILQVDEDLSTVEHRLSFIMDTLCGESDWIESGAATGLYYTLHSVVEDIKAIRTGALKEVRS